MRKFAGDIIILHVSIKNHSHMMYSSWDTEWDRLNCLSFWAILCPISSLTTQKIKIENWKKHLKILSVYIFAPQMTIIWCMVPEIWSTTDRIFCHQDQFLHFYTPMDSENQNFENMKKTPEDINILQMSTINNSHMVYGSWDMKCNGQNFLPFWTVFCSFTPLTTQTIKIFKKWKKCLEND